MLTKQNSQKGGKNPSLKKAVYHLSKRYIFQIIILKHTESFYLTSHLILHSHVHITLICTYSVFHVFSCLLPQQTPCPWLCCMFASAQGWPRPWALRRAPVVVGGDHLLLLLGPGQAAPQDNPGHQVLINSRVRLVLEPEYHQTVRTAYRNIWALAILQSKVTARKTQDKGWNWSFLSHRVKPAHWGTQFSKLKSKFWWG